MDIICEIQPQKDKNLYSSVSFCDRSITFHRIIKSTADPEKSSVFHNGGHVDNTQPKFCYFLSKTVLKLSNFLQTQNLIYQSTLIHYE